MALRKKKPPEPSAPNVPAYIVTFSDMVTLLLTFFVMLLSLAQVRDPELFNRSRDAFNEHINCYGLGLLTGKQMIPELDTKKVKYHIPNPDDDTTARTIDSRDETLRRLFNKAAESMQVMPSRINVQLSDYSPTPVYFQAGRTQLSEEDKRYLKQLSMEYRMQAAAGRMEVYILGVAADEPHEKQQWIISSLRAQQVADYLTDTGGLNCPIYAWGSGPGGSWIEPDSPVSQESHILIAFVRAD